ncbi:hypothetical protein [Bradyrhizobium sp. S3.2.12]|uniref:hypothetical protein n=1 Tax=Bradyrhizobium sp. S3.2.12 TaxID=3156387 RepID=UPI003393FD2F
MYSRYTTWARCRLRSAAAIRFVFAICLRCMSLRAPSSALVAVVAADSPEVKVKPSTAVRNLAVGSCPPTTSIGGDLTVKPFSIGGNSSAAIQALATSVRKQNAARGLLKSHAWYFELMFFEHGLRHDCAAFRRL